MVNPFSQSAGSTTVSGWAQTLNPGNTKIDEFNQRIKIGQSADGNNDTIARDLTLPASLDELISDTDWRLRVRFSWPTFNAFKNVDVANEAITFQLFSLSDKDQLVNQGFTTGNDEKSIGMRIFNFDGNDPTPAIRAGGSPVPPNGFRGLMQGYVKDTTLFAATPVFTPGGQPGSQSVTHLQVERSGSMVSYTLFLDANWDTIIEQHIIMNVPAAVVGQKFIKFGNRNFFAATPAFIDGFVLSYELLNGASFTPLLPIFDNGLAAKIYNDLGVNGPSTGDEVFARIFDDGSFPETWSRIREKHMYGFLEDNSLIQKDIDLIEWNKSTWSVV